MAFNMTREESEAMRQRTRQNRATRADGIKDGTLPVIAPPLPSWAKDGEPIPRLSDGKPNVTAQRIEEYKRRVFREFGRRVKV